MGDGILDLVGECFVVERTCDFVNAKLAGNEDSCPIGERFGSGCLGLGRKTVGRAYACERCGELSVARLNAVLWEWLRTDQPYSWLLNVKSSAPRARDYSLTPDSGSRLSQIEHYSDFRRRQVPQRDCGDGCLQRGEDSGDDLPGPAADGYFAGDFGR